MRQNAVLLGLIPIAAAAGILAYIFTAGSAPLGPGPLGPPGNDDTACMPANPGQADTEGLQTPTNSSHDALVIDHVALASPQNIRLVGAYIVPGTGIGEFHGFPPPAGQLPSNMSLARWRPAVGARVLPGQTIDVVVGLAAAGGHTTASTAGVEVFYHDGSTAYELVFNLHVIIKVAPATCF